MSAQCVHLRARCPGPLGSCSPVCSLGAFCFGCGVLGHLAPVHHFSRSVRCVACAVSKTPRLLFTGLPSRCMELRVRCPRPLGSSSAVCPLGALRCVCGVLGHFAPVHRRARSVRCSAFVVFSTTWFLFTGVPFRCVLLRGQWSGPLGSCSPVCSLAALPWIGGVLGHLAPVHWCAHSVCCVACAVSRAPWLLFSSVRARCVVLLRGVLGHLAPLQLFVSSVCCVA